MRPFRPLSLTFSPDVRSFFALSVGWTIAILVACLVPGEDLPVVNFALTDKVVHVALFAVFGLLWLRTMPTRRRAVLGWGLAFAVLIEVLQGSITAVHRSGDPFDVVADAIGLALAFAIDAAVGRRSRSTAPGLATGTRGAS